MVEEFRPTSTDKTSPRVGRRPFVVGLVLIGAGVVVACGSSGSVSAATAVARVSTGMGGLASAAQAANVNLVTMTGQHTFEPATLTVAAGSTVTWINNAATVQSATFDPALAATKGDIVLPPGVVPFDSGLVQPGQSWTHTFTTPGTYQYTCVPNEALGMKGTVLVT